MTEARPATAPPALGGELIAGVSGFLLLLAMIGLKWFGIAGAATTPFAPRSGTLSAESAWQTLTTLRWLMVLTIAVAMAAVVLRAVQRDHGARTDVSLIVTTLGTVTSALLIYRVLIELPGSGDVVDQKLGAFLGLLCAMGIAFGGYESRLQARRSSRPVVQRSRR